MGSPNRRKRHSVQEYINVRKNTKVVKFDVTSPQRAEASIDGSKGKTQEAVKQYIAPISLLPCELFRCSISCFEAASILLVAFRRTASQVGNSRQTFHEATTYRISSSRCRQTNRFHPAVIKLH